METIEPSSAKLTLSMQSKRPSECWLLEQLGLLAVRLGETVTPQRLALYVDDLADLSRAQLELALWRARRELKFFPKIAELRELAGAGQEQQQAEAHKAWDVLLNYVDTWVGADFDGTYRPLQGCRSCPPPKLDQRIDDCVRRLGGWKRLKTADESDLPFLKKDFLEEYSRWEAVDRIDVSHMLNAVTPTLQLKAMEPPAPTPVAPLDVPKQKPKPVYEPLTPQQIRDRREMLRQQAEVMKSKLAKLNNQSWPMITGTESVEAEVDHLNPPSVCTTSNGTDHTTEAL